MSQVRFPRSWPQDFRTHDRRSQVRGFQFQGSRSQGPVKVSGPRVLGPRVSSLRVIEVITFADNDFFILLVLFSKTITF